MAHADSTAGTPVTLVVSPGHTTPGHTTPVAPPPQHPLPNTGFELMPALALAAVLLAVGTTLTASQRRVPIRVRAVARP